MDISVRPLRRDEGAVLDTVFAGLSPRSRYLRFHSPVGDLGRGREITMDDILDDLAA